MDIYAHCPSKTRKLQQLRKAPTTSPFFALLRKQNQNSVIHCVISAPGGSDKDRRPCQLRDKRWQIWWCGESGFSAERGKKGALSSLFFCFSLYIYFQKFVHLFVHLWPKFLIKYREFLIAAKIFQQKNPQKPHQQAILEDFFWSGLRGSNSIYSMIDIAKNLYAV